MTPEMLAGLLALGPWGILAGVIIFIARRVEAGQCITMAHHIEIVTLHQARNDELREQLKEARGLAVISSNAAGQLAALLRPGRRYEDSPAAPAPELELR